MDPLGENLHMTYLVDGYGGIPANETRQTSATLIIMVINDAGLLGGYELEDARQVNLG